MKESYDLNYQASIVSISMYVNGPCLCLIIPVLDKSKTAISTITDIQMLFKFC